MNSSLASGGHRKRQCHARIIGAGPAGSVAAILLSRGGWRVTLIEQHRFPRDKVCGECLSSVGFDVLERLGLRHDHAVQLTHALLHAPGGASVKIDLPRPMWGLSRRVLDTWLLDQAIKSGAQVLQPARCEAVGPHPVSPTVSIRHLETNRNECLSADIVLVADGKTALFSDAPPSTGDMGIKSHWENVDGPHDAVELFGVSGHYVGLAGIEEERWNLAYSISAERVHRAQGNLDLLFKELVGENAALHARLRHATRVGTWLASPLPRYGVADAWPDGVIPIGNSAAALEPIGGEGMGLAMRSAELAAQALLSHSPVDSDDLRRHFKSLWNLRVVACRSIALAMSRPRVAEWLLGMAESSDALARMTLKLVGKA